ncbi:MAG: hypothetical protein H0X43_01815 [Nitrosospira sp.]|nr:hypothetical protein [Nitrosospira sp.]
MGSRPLSNTQNVINSKELLARIKWLEQQLNYRCSDEYSEELKALKEFAGNVEAAASVSTYHQGSDLVRDSYLEEYKRAREEPDKGSEQFSPMDFNGATYWLRKP